MRLASVEFREGRIIVRSWKVADTRLHIQGDWMEVIDESATSGELGALVRSARAASRAGVPTPDSHAGLMPEPQKLLKLAPGWQLTQVEPGILVRTSPDGRAEPCARSFATS